MTARSGSRPWVAFVRDIGPTYTFGHADRAHERAASLVDPDGDTRYAEVLVYDRQADPADMRRFVYRYDAEPREERFVLDGDRTRWETVPLTADAAKEACICGQPDGVHTFVGETWCPLATNADL